MRPGWGERHPVLAEILSAARPAATHDGAWANGAVRLRIAAYPAPLQVPVEIDDLVLSVRCLVRVGDEVVLCSNADGFSHVWPGGRREAGESLEQTACREVREETGWLVDPESLRPIGWLHYEYLDPADEDSPWPYPDFLQLVYVGRAHKRDGDADVAWTDTEGYELSSCLVSPEDARARVGDDGLELVFLDLLKP